MSKDKKKELWKVCSDFIAHNEITCSESVFRGDRVVVGSLELIEAICEIVGYHKWVDEDVDEKNERVPKMSNVCPGCGYSDGRENTIVDDGSSGFWRCWRCGDEGEWP